MIRVLLADDQALVRTVIVAYEAGLVAPGWTEP